MARHRISEFSGDFFCNGKPFLRGLPFFVFCGHNVINRHKKKFDNCQYEKKNPKGR